MNVENEFKIMRDILVNDCPWLYWFMLFVLSFTLLLILLIGVIYLSSM